MKFEGVFINRVCSLKIYIKGITRMIAWNCFHSWRNAVCDLCGNSKELFTGLGEENRYIFICKLMKTKDSVERFCYECVERTEEKSDF